MMKAFAKKVHYAMINNLYNKIWVQGDLHLFSSVIDRKNSGDKFLFICYRLAFFTGCCVSIQNVDGKGALTVNPIDRDAKDLSTYAFQIMAQEEDDPPFNVTLNITFILEDIDDNSPLFKQVFFSNGSSVTLKDGVTKVIEFSFLENFAETINGTIWIQDIDTVSDQSKSTY